MNNKTKEIKLVVLNLMAVFIASSNIGGFAPVGMGFASALYGNGSPGIPAIMAMLIGMTNNFNTVLIIKYISAFLAIIVISKLISVDKLKVNEYARAIICFLAVFAAALMLAFNKAIKAFLCGRTMYNNEEMLSAALIVGLAIYSAGDRFTIPMSGIEIILFFSILYGAYKYGAGMGAIIGSACGISLCLWNDDAKYLGIMCMIGIAAGIFRELGRLISNNIIKGVLGAGVIFILLPRSIIYRFEENLNDKEENGIRKILEERLISGAKAIERLSKSILSTGGKEVINEGDASDITLNKIWKNKFDESRNIMSGQLKQISKIIEEYSKEIYDFVKISAEEEEFIRHRLKGKKVYMDKMVEIENRRHKREYLITAKCEKGITVGTREMADIISEVFGKTYMSSRNCRQVLSNEYTTTTYVEEANFYVLHGAARKARGESGISGDNYSLKELENGQVLMGIQLLK